MGKIDWTTSGGSVGSVGPTGPTGPAGPSTYAAVQTALSASAGATTTISGPTSVELFDGATGAGGTVLTLRHITSGSATTNFDVQVPIELENAAGVIKSAAYIIGRWVGASAGNETFQIAFRMMGVGGTATSDKFLFYFENNTFGEYCVQTGGYISVGTTGYRHNVSGLQVGGGYYVDGSGNMVAKVYDSHDFIVSLGGSGGSGLAEKLRVQSASVKCSVPAEVPSYTVVGVPAATTAGRIIYVSDESGGAVLAFSDGVNWRRVTDRAIIS